MQHAIKLALVPYESALSNKAEAHQAYRDLNKTADGVAKANISLQMARMLHDPEDRVPDDVQLKLYNQALRRFLTVSSQLKDDQPVAPTNYWADNVANQQPAHSGKRKKKPKESKKRQAPDTPLTDRPRRKIRRRIQWSPLS